MMKKYTLLLAVTFLSIAATAQIVNIPDANFKAALVNEIAINSNIDGEIQVSEATAYTGLIDVNNKNISDLTGIEAFVNLTQLKCYNNNLTTINVASNTALTIFAIGQNPLTTIDVSNNTNLTGLSVDLTQLTTLNISNNPSLTDIVMFGTPITALNTNTNVNLKNLNISRTSITSLNVSNNTLLTNLFAQKTLISNLNLTANTSLQVVWLDSNINLTSLNIKNGNNTAIFSFQARGNPNLTCIQVDDTAWANTNWTQKDAIANYSTNCSVGVNEWQQNNAAVSTYPNPVKEQLTVNVNTKNNLFLATLTDYTGKIVLQTNLYNNKTLDVSHLPNGIYQLTLKSNNFIAVKKVVVAR